MFFAVAVMRTRNSPPTVDDALGVLRTKTELITCSMVPYFDFAELECVTVYGYTHKVI
jgi:hypothetical protein